MDRKETTEFLKQLLIRERFGGRTYWSSEVSNCNPESSLNFGIMVPVPYNQKAVDEYENPTKLHPDMRWKLSIVYPCNAGRRERSIAELLFCMLRSGH